MVYLKILYLHQMNKGTKLYSILKNKCPRCMEGAFYVNDNLFTFSMNKKCAHCGLDFEHEPGFYIGAMYISYAQGVLIALLTGLTLYYTLHLTFTQILIGIAIMIILSSPVNFRFSRLIWINIWIKYKPDNGNRNY